MVAIGSSNPTAGIGGIGGIGSVGGSDKGILAQGSFAKMGTDQLLNILQNGTQADKLNALNAIIERLTGKGSEASEGANSIGGPASNGTTSGSGGIEELLAKILEKLLKGESINAQDINSLKQGLQGAPMSDADIR